MLEYESDVPWEWDEWTDFLGNVYKVGDKVLVATISGRSPQMVLARVERINRRKSNGQEITDRKWFEHPQPITKTRHNGVPYEERGEHRNVPGCTVTATPLIDGRSFGRSSGRKVTYTLTGNIVKAV